MAPRCIGLLRLGAAAALAAVLGSEASEAHEAVPSFESFIAAHGRTYERGSAEFERRRQLYEHRAAEVAVQNMRTDRLWTAAINQFADWTEEELKQLRGYRHLGAEARPAMAEEEDETAEGEDGQRSALPAEISWRNLSASRLIPEQGSCGSCWAVTTVSVLTAHHEIYRGSARQFSAQELVSCVPNPQQCGGAGGCKGATVELALDYTMKKGLRLESEVPYRAQDLPCPGGSPSLADGDWDEGEDERRDAEDTRRGDAQEETEEDRPAEGRRLWRGVGGGRSFGLTGFNQLPRNKEEPLARAVVERGPVAVSTAAAGWFMYSGGIFDGCPKDVVVDHAVTLYGYGQQNGRKYWLIRNSWGADWGEGGYIRMLRREDEERHCGIDRDPQQGVDCKGGPTQVTVCGTCGVLYDSVVPLFAPADSKGRSLAVSASSEPLSMREARRHLKSSVSASVAADGAARLVRRHLG